MSAKSATRTSDPAFKTHGTELAPHHTVAVANTSLPLTVQPLGRDSARQSADSGAILLRLPLVMRRTGLARSTIYKLVATNRFPAPIKLTTRSVAWLQCEIDNWIASCARVLRAPH